MKKIAYFLGALLITGTFASCDINNVENIGEMSTSEFPKTDGDIEAVLAGVYQNLNTTHANPQCSFLYAACLASDDQLGGGGTNDKLMQAEDLLCNYNADMTNQFYADRYAGIARANTLLNVLEHADGMAEDVKKKGIGEAKFLRAFYYYELSSMYGNVPLITSPDQENSSQGDVKVLWGQILQDLRDACELLPAQQRTDGRIDKYTAEAMLSRAWLYYTGMYCNGTGLADLVSTVYKPLTSVDLPDGKALTKNEVIAYIDDCVNNSGYKLVDDFRTLWAYTNNKVVEDYPYTKGKGLTWVENDNAVNPEALFSIKFNKLASWQTTIGYANGIALHFGVRGGQDYANTFPFGQGWGAGPVAPNLVNDWKAAEPNDIRLQASIANVNDTLEMPNYTRGGWADFVQESDYYSKKWSPICAKNDGSFVPKEGDTPAYLACFETLMYPGNWDTSGENNFQLSNIHDLVLIRFADVLLMQSELKEDVSGINAVRKRAGLSPISSYSLAALQNERRWELACEGVRWNDIRRWHIAATALAKQENQPIYYCGNPDTNKAHNGGYIARYNATAGFQKMPETQIALGTVKQNDGWSDASSEYAGW
ncbi:MAG: RagB/SusD family nutrient uptake outer membrane protein [Prevotella sp.]|nr:RagB/SusD family nutrient uptake outer membrane protein [Prevotella sp.]MBQ1701876.1 RagB/SusD family nutrient uptake outer membrane protein [Prevotella sp.]MBQ2131438.1 RagB/SusD family nutrient uptake outer membrane protein [Prevotella sp.]MBQ2588954.1 RagB/SusD family nutrient uptake outer membrane protein [Prevotella sp.]MBQ5506664.1 RagB/SusD family nutrient uptake outer membrane protein [Prevotella sp.]